MNNIEIFLNPKNPDFWCVHRVPTQHGIRTITYKNGALYHYGIKRCDSFTDEERLKLENYCEKFISSIEW